MDKRLLNINLLGLGFMFVLTSFFTVSNIEKIVLESIGKDDHSFTGDGYTSLCIIYAALAVSNWWAPAIIGQIGSRKSMCLGSMCYVAFLTPFLWPSNFLLYVMSALLGFGASVIWTGQGTYLTLNSDSSTMSRNSGIFMAMSKTSICVGNAFMILVLCDKNELDKSAKNLIFVVLAVVGGFGTLILIMLQPSTDATGRPNEMKQGTDDKANPIQELKNSTSLFLTNDMRLLSTLFFFTGLHTSLYSGVYSSCIAFTKSIGDSSEQLLGYTGLLVGIGEVTGGVLCCVFGRKSAISDGREFDKTLSRPAVVIVSFFINIVAYILIMINLPNNSPFGDTQDKSIIAPNKYLAVFCGFLLGLGDSGYITQIYNIIGVKYADNSASATSLFMFMQAVSASVYFYNSNMFGLHVQLVIIIISMIIGTLSFLKVDKYTYDK